MGDGLLTVTNPDDSYFNDLLFPAVERGLESSARGKHPFQKHVELQISFDEDYDKAVQSVRPWAGNILPVFFNLAVYDPKMVEDHGKFVGDKELGKIWVITTSSEPIVKAIERFVRLGFDGVHITSSSPSQEKFMKIFEKEIKPSFENQKR